MAERVGGDHKLIEAAEVDAARGVTMPAFDDILASLVEAPSVRRDRRYPRRTSEKGNRGRIGVNYIEREGANRELGAKGELFALEYERARLVAEDRENLAAQVEHVARTRGDGLGYDILSFEASSRERIVEVKTTKHGKETPFFVSRNEVGVSRERPREYCLYRIFSFAREPRFFFKRGALDHEFALEPESYRARIA